MLEYKGYLGRAEFDDEAGIFHGHVINIRDVITFQGSSLEEIREAFHHSVDDYFEFCRERGEEPDKPSSGQIVTSDVEDADTVYATAEIVDSVMAENDANDPALEYYSRKYSS